MSRAGPGRDTPGAGHLRRGRRCQRARSSEPLGGGGGGGGRRGEEEESRALPATLKCHLCPLVEGWHSSTSGFQLRRSTADEKVQREDHRAEG